MIVSCDELDLAISNSDHIFVCKRVLRHFSAIDVGTIGAAEIREPEPELGIKNQRMMTAHETVANANLAQLIPSDQNVTVVDWYFTNHFAFDTRNESSQRAFLAVDLP